jgi:hypothetical protein
MLNSLSKNALRSVIHDLWQIDIKPLYIKSEPLHGLSIVLKDEEVPITEYWAYNYLTSRSDVCPHFLTQLQQIDPECW